MSQEGEHAHTGDNNGASSNPFFALGSTFASLTLGEEQGNGREPSSIPISSLGEAFLPNQAECGLSFNPFLSLGGTSASPEATRSEADNGSSSLPPLGGAFPPLQPVTSFNSFSWTDADAVASGMSSSYSCAFANSAVAAGIAAALIAIAEWKADPAPNLAELHGSPPVEWIEELLHSMEGVPALLPTSLGNALLSEFFLSGCEDVVLLQSLLSFLPWDSFAAPPLFGDRLTQLRLLDPFLRFTDHVHAHREEPDSQLGNGKLCLPDIESSDLTFNWMQTVMCKQELFLRPFLQRLGPKSLIFDQAISLLALDDRIEAFTRLPWTVFVWADELPMPSWPLHVDAIMALLTGALSAAKSESRSAGDAQAAVGCLASVILRMLRSSMREHASVALLQNVLNVCPSWASAHLRLHFGEVVNTGVAAGPSFFAVLQESPLFDHSWLGVEALLTAVTNRQRELGVTVLQNTSVAGLLQRPTKTSTVPLFAALSQDWDYEWILEIFEGKSSEFPLAEPLLTTIRSHSDAFYAVCTSIARMGHASLLARLLDIAKSLQLEVAARLLDVLDVCNAWACSPEVFEAILLHVKGVDLRLRRVGSLHSILFETLDTPSYSPTRRVWARALLDIVGPKRALEPESIAAILPGLKRVYFLDAITFLLCNCERVHFDAPGLAGNNVLHVLASTLPHAPHQVSCCKGVRAAVSDCLTTQRNDDGLLPIEVLCPSPKCPEGSAPYEELKCLLTPVTFAKRA